MPNAPYAISARVSALLAGVLQWRDRDSDVRRAAREAFSNGEWPQEVVEVALDNVFYGAQRVLAEESRPEGRLQSSQSGPLKSSVSGLKDVLAILPGNVVGPTIATAYCAAAAGATIMLKSSSRELRLAEIVAAQFESLGPPLAKTVTPFRWSGGDEDFEAKIFPQASRIVVFGDDLTIADVRRRAPDGIDVIGYGSAYSLGFVPSSADPATAAEAAAGDVALFDQRGCLSPQTIYVEGDEAKAILFAHALAGELHAIGRVLPRASSKKTEEAAVAEFIRRLLIRALPTSAHALDAVILGSRESGIAEYVVGVEHFSAPVCAGFGRIVIVKPCRSPLEAASAAKQLGNRLDTIGIAGPLAPQLLEAFAKSGASRICLLGEMQRPPLGYRPTIADFVSEHCA
jgi:Acyl-CoA reductase (LuxC)